MQGQVAEQFIQLVSLIVYTAYWLCRFTSL